MFTEGLSTRERECLYSYGRDEGTVLCQLIATADSAGPDCEFRSVYGRNVGDKVCQVAGNPVEEVRREYDSQAYPPGS